MRALEDAVVEIECALEPAAKAPLRLMSTYEDDIPASARYAIQAKLAEIHAEIRDAKDSYDLSTDAISNRRRFSAKLSILAIDVTECRPEYLRAYGEVPDKEKTALSERMSRLESLVTHLNKAIRQ
jgi:hypothetical protein